MKTLPGQSCYAIDEPGLHNTQSSVCRDLHEGLVKAPFPHVEGKRIQEGLSLLHREVKAWKDDWNAIV